MAYIPLLGLLSTPLDISSYWLSCTDTSCKLIIPPVVELTLCKIVGGFFCSSRQRLRALLFDSRYFGSFATGRLGRATCSTLSRGTRIGCGPKQLFATTFSLLLCRRRRVRFLVWSDFPSSSARLLPEKCDYSDETEILRFSPWSGKSKKLTSCLSGERISRMPRLHWYRFGQNFSGLNLPVASVSARTLVSDSGPSSFLPVLTRVTVHVRSGEHACCPAWLSALYAAM